MKHLILILGTLIVFGCAEKKEELDPDIIAQCNYSGLMGAWGDQNTTLYFMLSCKGIIPTCNLQEFTFRVDSPGMGSITMLTDGIGGAECLPKGEYPLFFNENSDGSLTLSYGSVTLTSVPPCNGCGLKPHN